MATLGDAARRAGPGLASGSGLVPLFARPAGVILHELPASPGRSPVCEQLVSALLSDITIQRELGALRGWSRRGDALVKTFSWPTFPEGIAFVERVAEAAERAQHHPDIDIRYTKVTCSLSTHDAGGITEKDIALARAIEAAAE